MDNNSNPLTNAPQGPAMPQNPAPNLNPSQMPTMATPQTQNPTVAQAPIAQNPQGFSNAPIAQNPSSYNPTLQNPQDTPKGKGSKTIIIAIVVLVFLIIVAGLIYAILSSSQKSKGGIATGDYDKELPIHIAGEITYDSSVDIWNEISIPVPGMFVSKNNYDSSYIEYESSTEETEYSKCGFSIRVVKGFTNPESFAKLAANDQAGMSEKDITTLELGDRTWYSLSTSSEYSYQNTRYALINDKVYEFTYFAEKNADLTCRDLEMTILDTITVNEE